jgi:hypothetical protein
VGDNGSDFGVGRAEPKGIREPVAVAGIRGVQNGQAAPWLGLRFADELANQLRAPMKKSADANAVAQFLAARRIAAWQVSPAPTSSTPSAANAMRTWPAYRNFPLVVVGEITLGKANTPDTRLNLRLRALRWEKSALRAASPDVSLSAPLGEWPQLPARAALALLDALSVSLTEDERIAMLRAASPLQPSATTAQLASEKLLGEMQYEALRSHFLNQPPVRETAGARALRLRAANAFGGAARKKLAALSKRSAAVRAKAANWRPFVFSVSRTASARYRALPKAAR